MLNPEPGPSFYHSAPVVRIRGPGLFLQSSFFQQLSNLFSHCTRVHFDNSKKVVTIRKKQWWRWKKPIRIRYADVNYIDLAYPRAVEHEKDEPAQIHKLLLIARNPFRKMNIGWTGGVLSQGSFARKHAQTCVDLISRHTRFRFGVKPREMPPTEFNDRYICKSCGHRLHPDSEFVLCKYCGGTEIDIVG